MKEFDIAFSYASEQITIVNQYKAKLEALGLSVFIDTEHPELFVFNYVPDILKRVYDDTNIAMVIFLSKDYVRKDFTKYEGRIAFDRLLVEKRISIIRIDDDAKLSWLPSSLHYFDIHKNSIDYVCNALYTAIKGEKAADISVLFNSIKKALTQQDKTFKINSNLETCILFSFLQNEEMSIMIKYNPDELSIIFYNYFSGSDWVSTPIAKINKLENHFILYNLGISDSDNLTSSFFSEAEICNKILHILDCYGSVI